MAFLSTLDQTERRKSFLIAAAGSGAVSVTLLCFWPVELKHTGSPRGTQASDWPQSEPVDISGRKMTALNPLITRSLSAHQRLETERELEPDVDLELHSVLFQYPISKA